MVSQVYLRFTVMACCELFATLALSKIFCCLPNLDLYLRVKKNYLTLKMKIKLIFCITLLIVSSCLAKDSSSEEKDKQEPKEKKESENVKQSNDVVCFLLGKRVLGFLFVPFSNIIIESALT